MSTPEPVETLMTRAVADRDAHPWRYYRFEWADAQKWLDKLSARVDELEAALAQRFAPTPPTWLPTAKNINALPAPLRSYIHQLETSMADPTGDCAALVLTRHQNQQLTAALAEYESAPIPPELGPILNDMRLASEEIDSSSGTSQYASACIALALVARHFLRELDAIGAPSSRPPSEAAR